jgi:hypothetical protein
MAEARGRSVGAILKLEIEDAAFDTVDHWKPLERVLV